MQPAMRRWRLALAARDRLLRETAVAGAALTVLLLAAAAAVAFWSSTGAGAGQAEVGDLAAPTGVSVSSFGPNVTVNWTAVVPAAGPVTGYTVTRWASGTSAHACGTDPNNPASFLPAGITSCVDSGVADGTYTYTVTAVFRSWTAQSAPSSADTVVGDQIKPSQSVAVASGATDAYLAGTTIYYRGGAAGAFQLADTVSSTASGPASAAFPAVAATGWTHPAETVTTGGGSAPNITYTSSAYSWTASPTVPAALQITGRDVAGNTVATTVTPTPDSTGPTGAALTVNAVAASGAGTVSYARAAFFINTRTDYAADTGAGVASSVLTVASTPILSGNTCGAFGTPAVITGTPTQSGLTDGCYLYTLTGTDNVGNTTSISTTVKYDTTAPTQTVSLTPGLGGAAITGNVIYYRYTAAGSFTLTDVVTDTTTPASAAFPVVSTTGWTHPAETVTTGSGTAPTISYPSASFSWAANPSIPGTYTVVGSDAAGNQTSSPLTFTRDATAPTGGKLTVNAVNSSAAGTSSYNKTGAFTISLRTDFTDATAGIATSTLTVASAPLTGNSCGTFGTPTVVVGTPAQSGLTTGCYQYALTGTDRVGNTALTSTTVKVDLAAPTGGALTVNGLAATSAGSTGTPTNLVSFPIDARTDYADAESGIKTSTLTRAAATLSAGSCGTFGTATTLVGTPIQTGLTTSCYKYVLTGTDNAGNTASVSSIVKYDVTAPTAGALTVNSVAASAAGTTSTANTASFTIGTRTANTDAGSGLASSILTRQPATLTGTSCGAYGTATVITGNPTQTGLITGCYLFTLTGIDNAGNTTSVATTVKLGPYPTAVTLQNGTGIAGRVDQGDKIIITYSDPLAVTSLCSTWTGNNGNQTLSGDNQATVTLTDGGASNDTLTVTSTACTLNVGTINLGATSYTAATVNYAGAAANATTVAWNAASQTLTITLGQPSGTGPATVTSSTATYTPSANIQGTSGTSVGGSFASAAVKQF